MVTLCPTGSNGPNSSVAVSEASTVTGAALDSSAAVMNRPDERVRSRTESHDGVVPTTVVVQFVEPLTSDWLTLCNTGATPLTSGAAVFDDRAVASAMVSVDADPNPPRTPPLVELPGETISRFPPSAASCLDTFCCAPCPSPTVRTTAAMPMRMPSAVRVERSLWARMESQPLPIRSDHVTGHHPRRRRRSRRRGYGSPAPHAGRPRPRG